MPTVTAVCVRIIKGQEKDTEQPSPRRLHTDKGAAELGRQRKSSSVQVLML